MAHVTCKTCRRRVELRWPPGGDGTIVLAFRHPDEAGQPCMGSGEAYDVGDEGVNVAGLVVDDDQAEDEGEAVAGILRPRTIGTIARRVLHQGRLFQLEYRRCGKRPGGKGRPLGCKCMRSNNPQDWHGPYPYAYATTSKAGGSVFGNGGWKRLTKFPAVGYRLLGIEGPDDEADE